MANEAWWFDAVVALLVSGALLLHACRLRQWGQTVRARANLGAGRGGAGGWGRGARGEGSPRAWDSFGQDAAKMLLRCCLRHGTYTRVKMTRVTARPHTRIQARGLHPGQERADWQPLVGRRLLDGQGRQVRRGRTRSWPDRYGRRHRRARGGAISDARDRAESIGRLGRDFDKRAGLHDWVAPTHFFWASSVMTPLILYVNHAVRRET